jgi:hypothetical protein
MAGWDPRGNEIVTPSTTSRSPRCAGLRKSGRVALALLLVLLAACWCAAPADGPPAAAPSNPSLDGVLERLAAEDGQAARSAARQLAALEPHSRRAVAVALLARLDRMGAATPAGEVGACLDALRCLAPLPALAEVRSLEKRLPMQSALYADRDKLEAVRLRVFVVLTLTALGRKQVALPAILDYLANSHSVEEFAAGARGAAMLGALARSTAPSLLQPFESHYHDWAVSLDRFPGWGVEEATSARLEAVRALGRLGRVGPEVLETLRAFARTLPQEEHPQTPLGNRLAGEVRATLVHLEKGP